jgi:DNA gyrase subunit B
MPERPVGGTLYGIGMKAVNSLSERLVVEVHRDGKHWRQEYCRGRSISPLEAVGDSARTGTLITFWPDPEIFPDTRAFQFDLLADRLQEVAFLHKGLHIRLRDRRTRPQRKATLHAPEGIVDWGRHLTREQEPVHSDIFHFHVRSDNREVEVALQWTKAEGETVVSFVNCCPTTLGGTHVQGLRRAVTPTLQAHFHNHGLVPDTQGMPNGKDCWTGLTAVVVASLPDPWFAGSTKEKVINPELSGLVEKNLRRTLAEFLEAHPADARAIAAHILTMGRGSTRSG